MLLKIDSPSRLRINPLPWRRRRQQPILFFAEHTNRPRCAYAFYSAQIPFTYNLLIANRRLQLRNHPFRARLARA